MGTRPRPAIPEPIKREVRQRCLFGCVICGMPVFDYDHIVEYAEVREHAPENLTLLCPNHHRDKTSGRLDQRVVEERNRSPFNSTRALTAGYPLEPSPDLKIEFGTCYLIEPRLPNGEDKAAVVVNGRTFLAYHNEDGWLTFSAIVTDRHGRLLLKITRGEVVASTSVWDLTYIGSQLLVREGRGQILLDMLLTNSELNIRRGAFIDPRDRSGFIASPEGLEPFVGRQSFGTMKECAAGACGGAAWVCTNEATPPWDARHAFRLLR